MSDKDRQKKDGRDKNKKNQARRADNQHSGVKVADTEQRGKAHKSSSGS